MTQTGPENLYSTEPPTNEADLQSGDRQPEHVDLASVDQVAGENVESTESADEVTIDLAKLVAERTEDLQRLQAEYVNYKRRVDRDRAVAREKGAESVIRELMPVFDAIHAARQQGATDPGLEAVSNELIRIGTKLGLLAFGERGDEFDPQQHEALMQIPSEDIEPMHVAQVIQQGFKLNDLVVRPARVAVAAEPEGS